MSRTSEILSNLDTTAFKTGFLEKDRSLNCEVSYVLKSSIFVGFSREIRVGTLPAATVCFQQ